MHDAENIWTIYPKHVCMTTSLVSLSAIRNLCHTCTRDLFAGKFADASSTACKAKFTEKEKKTPCLEVFDIVHIWSGTKNKKMSVQRVWTIGPGDNQEYPTPHRRIGFKGFFLWLDLVGAWIPYLYKLFIYTCRTPVLLFPPSQIRRHFSFLNI